MIERYKLPERLIHWLAAVTYLYLLATGLASTPTAIAAKIQSVR